MTEFFGFLPEPLPLLAAAVATAAILLGFIAPTVMFFIWLERKISARIQDRLGPTRTGGRFGWAQSLADGIKLLTKEDTIPAGADRWLFRLAPHFAFAAAFAGFLALPFSAGVVGYGTEVSAFFLLAVLASEVFGVILAGYASASKWSLFGGIREAAQVVSYEVPRAICVLIPITVVGSLDLNLIAREQVGFLPAWNLFHDPFMLLALPLYFICATASCKRAPFDLAEAESELVAGFHTEYSGLRWSFFFMAEYASMFAVSSLGVLLFAGGWHTGLLPFEPSERWGLVGHLLNVGVFIGKGVFCIVLMMWLRWSLPRLRIDQVMTICLKYFLPLAAVLLVGSILWGLVIPESLATVWRYGSAGLLTLSVIALVVRVLTAPLAMPRGELPGVWAGVQTPGMRGGR